MKCLWKKVICGALVAGMLAQCPQSIYAEDAANTATVTDTESNHVTPDTTQQPDDTKQPGDTQQPDDTQQPGDIQQPDDIQQPEELPQPSAVEGLHTTKQGKTKVYLEWEESSDATSYAIYRKTAGGEYKKLAESSKPSYTDKNVSSGKTYTYKIVAKNEQKEADEAMQKRIALDVKKILIPRVKAQYPAHVQALFNDNIIYHVNPTGKFVIGGPHGDTGLTGRKIIVDTYGGKGAHGGGAFSGKDPSKVDRSAAYAARHIAKNMVAAGVADEMLVQVSYAIGVAKPMNIFVNTFGRAKVNMTDGEIAAKIWDIFDMRPKAIEERLKLRNPIYFETASYGHMGRKPQTVTKTFSSRYLQKPVTCDVELFTWEKLDYADKIKDVFGL